MQMVWRSKKYGIDFRGHRTVTGIADQSGKKAKKHRNLTSVSNSEVPLVAPRRRV